LIALCRRLAKSLTKQAFTCRTTSSIVKSGKRKKQLIELEMSILFMQIPYFCCKHLIPWHTLMTADQSKI
jgi:hypothetical protein